MWNSILDYWYDRFWEFWGEGPYVEEPYEKFEPTPEDIIRHKESSMINAPHLDDPKVITIKEVGDQ